MIIIIINNNQISLGLSALEVGGIVGGAVAALLLVLVCGCAGGVMVVYLLRQRKIRKMKGFPYTKTLCGK